MLLSGRADPSFGEAAGRITADAERVIEEVRRDDHDLASYLRIEERELEDR